MSITNYCLFGSDPKSTSTNKRHSQPANQVTRPRWVGSRCASFSFPNDRRGRRSVNTTFRLALQTETEPSASPTVKPDEWNTFADWTAQKPGYCIAVAGRLAIARCCFIPGWKAKPTPERYSETERGADPSDAAMPNSLASDSVTSCEAVIEWGCNAQTETKMHAPGRNPRVAHQPERWPQVE